MKATEVGRLTTCSETGSAVLPSISNDEYGHSMDRDSIAGSVVGLSFYSWRVALVQTVLRDGLRHAGCLHFFTARGADICR